MKTNEGGAIYGAIGKERSRLLAIALVLVMICTGAVVLAGSGSYAAEGDVVEFSEGSLQDAVNGLENGTTLKLTADVVLDSPVTIASGQEITINLNAHSITVTESFESRPIMNYGTLTVIDSGNGTGKIDSSNAGSMGYGAIGNYGVLTVMNGTFTGHMESDGAAIRSWEGSTTTIYDGKFIGSPCCVNVQGDGYIYGGVFYSESCSACHPNSWSYAVKNTGDGSLYIYDAEVTGTQGAIASASGYTEIHGGTFKTVHCPINEAHTADHYALYTAGELNETATTVYGGTFQSYSRVAVLVGNSADGGNQDKATLMVYGGNFSVSNNDAIDVIDVDSQTATVPSATVYAGTFDRALIDGIVAAESTVTTTEDGITVTGPSEDEANYQAGDQYFIDFGLALGYLSGENDTIKLVKDVTDSIKIPAGSKAILDLNGFTLDGGTTRSTPAIDNEGILTIIDSSENQTGVIKRSDEGGGSHYVIDNSGTLTISSGTITNNSGYPDIWQGSSLIRNLGSDADNNAVLNITGGHIYQKNFIAVKNDDFGTLNVTGGLIEAGASIGGNAGASAIQNWNIANITGGTVNGSVMTCVWEREPDNSEFGDSKTVIGGTAEINGVLEASYDTTAPSNTSKAYIEIQDGATVKVSSVYVSRGVIQGDFELLSGGSIIINEGGAMTSTVTGPDGNTLILNGFTAYSPATITAGSFIIDGSWIGEMTVSGNDIVVTGTLSEDATLTIKPQSDGTPTNITWSNFQDNGATINYVGPDGETVEPEAAANQTYSGNVSIGGLTITNDSIYTYNGTSQYPGDMSAYISGISSQGFINKGQTGLATGSSDVGVYMYQDSELVLTDAVDAGTYYVYYGYFADGVLHSYLCEWEIVPAELSIIVDATGTYDGENFEFIIPADHEDGEITITGLVSGDQITEGTFQTVGADVGTYDTYGEWTFTSVVINNDDSAKNYIVTVSASLTIEKRELGIVFSAHKTYDGENFEYTLNYPDADVPQTELVVNGLVDGQTITGTITTNADGVKTYSIGTEGDLTYSITVSGGNDNYEIVLSGSLTINPKALTITDATIVDKTYDGTTAATVTGVMFEGLVDGESVTIVTDYTATAEFVDSNAGTGKSISVTVTANMGNLTLMNYSLPEEATVLEGYTISKRVISVTGGTVPDKTYDGTKSGTVTSVTFDGLIGTDTLTMGEDFTATAEYPWGPDAGIAQNSYLKMAVISVTLEDDLNYIFTGGSPTEDSPQVSSHILPIEITDGIVDVTYAPSANGIQVTISVSSKGMTPDALTVTHTPAGGQGSTDNPFVVEESAIYTITMSTTDGNWSVPEGFQMEIEVELNTVSFYTKSTIDGEYVLEQTASGTDITTPNATVIPEGYVLIGWSTTADGEKEYGVGIYIDVPVSGMVLYAVYEKDTGADPGTDPEHTILYWIQDAINFRYVNDASDYNSDAYIYTAQLFASDGGITAEYGHEYLEALLAVAGGEATDEQEALAADVMNDFARYMGAIYRNSDADGTAGVTSVFFNGKEYTWQSHDNGKWYNGSNWLDSEGKTLVSAVTLYIAGMGNTTQIAMEIGNGTEKQSMTYGLSFQDASEPEEYVVQLQDKDGYTVETVTGLVSGSAVLLPQTISVNGETVSVESWSIGSTVTIQADVGYYFVDPQHAVNGTITMVATVAEVQDSVTVTYYDGTQVLKVQVMYPGEFFEFPQVSLTDGETFDGWYADEEYVTPAGTSLPEGATGTYALYAKVNEAPEESTYGIVFMNGDQTLTYSGYTGLAEGATIALPSTVDGLDTSKYRLNGWYLDGKLPMTTYTVRGVDAVEGTITLHADIVQYAFTVTSTPAENGTFTTFVQNGTLVISVFPAAGYAVDTVSVMAGDDALTVVQTSEVSYSVSIQSDATVTVTFKDVSGEQDPEDVSTMVDVSIGSLTDGVQVQLEALVGILPSTLDVSVTYYYETVFDGMPGFGSNTVSLEGVQISADNSGRWNVNVDLISSQGYGSAYLGFATVTYTVGETDYEFESVLTNIIHAPVTS